jgi:hypothetical protein
MNMHCCFFNIGLFFCMIVPVFADKFVTLQRNERGNIRKAQGVGGIGQI